jgi:hypothetical protein
MVMDLLKTYFEIQKQIYDYFGYVEDWVKIPLDDSTDYWWILDEAGSTVRFSENKETIWNGAESYENCIYTQRFLPKWVYRAKDYTMICVDTRCDGNHFLQVFDNTKEIKGND